MKQALTIRVEQCLARAGRGDPPACWHYDLVIDARTPSEFAQDHIPGSVNWPVLDDEERAWIGTMYKLEGSFKAKREGAILVARNIASLLEKHSKVLDQQARLLVYCWRGGNRSGALSTVLSRIGFRTEVLEGGYKAYRRWVIDHSRERVQQFQLCVIAGRTGSGKTDLLQHLEALGEQVIDLEALAKHRGSLLGAEPGECQPSQKLFESALWLKLSRFNEKRPIWLESESRKIGQLQIPEPLIEAMRASMHYQLDAPIDIRREYLLEHYQHWIESPAKLDFMLQKIKLFISGESFSRLESSLREKRMADFVHHLLECHYDPLYDRSMARNYRYNKRSVELHCLSATALSMKASEIIENQRQQDDLDRSLPKREHEGILHIDQP